MDLRRIRWKELVPAVVLLSVVVVVGGVWALNEPGGFAPPGASPQPGPGEGYPSSPPTTSSSVPEASSTPTPTPTGLPSFDPTAVPTIPECIAPRRFTVLTFNIHGGRTDDGIDLAAVAAEIKTAQADVVLLQEVDRNLARTGFRDEPAVLGEALGMAVYYSSSVRSNAILTRFPVMEWSSTRLPLWPDKEERRLVHASVLVEGQLVHVFNTHLDHTSVSLRLAQIRAVKRLMARYADEPMILGGDLNATARGPVLDTVRSYLRDAWPGVGEGPGNTVPAHHPRRRIDYLLHNSWLSPHAAHVVPTLTSDHWALRIVFDLWGTEACTS